MGARLFQGKTPGDAPIDKSLTSLVAQALFNHAPDYQEAVRMGRDARYLWFALRDWRDADPEEYFGRLGVWAEMIMKGWADYEAKVVEASQ